MVLYPSCWWFGKNNFKFIFEKIFLPPMIISVLYTMFLKCSTSGAQQLLQMLFYKFILRFLICLWSLTKAFQLRIQCRPKSSVIMMPKRC